MEAPPSGLSPGVESPYGILPTSGQGTFVLAEDEKRGRGSLTWSYIERLRGTAGGRWG
ncbi:hypothetical protein GCM10010394_20680 [Streptomyces crystallinus]|uniref:Uncharacterized protein n=1 Tax=Streptomyces crystallinus TaxID=68191 RepID=A0ABP3QNV1_9ACTN